MPYSQPSDVKKLINTDLTEAELAAVIVDADADLDDRLDGSSMTADNKRQCSMRLAAIMIAQQQRTIFRSSGEYQQGGYSIREWQRYVNNKVTKAQGGRWDSVG
jgi:hypothetical protein